MSQPMVVPRRNTPEVASPETKRSLTPAVLNSEQLSMRSDFGAQISLSSNAIGKSDDQVLAIGLCNGSLLPKRLGPRESKQPHIVVLGASWQSKRLPTFWHSAPHLAVPGRLTLTIQSSGTASAQQRRDPMQRSYYQHGSVILDPRTTTWFFRYCFGGPSKVCTSGKVCNQERGVAGCRAGPDSNRQHS